MMIRRAEAGAIAVRFEDIVTQPMQTCDQLYKALDVRWAEDRRFEFKIKPYGEQRTKDVDVGDGEFIRLGAGDVGRRIDRSVLRGERDRLSDDQRKTIWNLTGEMATHFGYDQSGSC
jgi:hypothetical protein